MAKTFPEKVKAMTAERPHLLEGEFLARYAFALKYAGGKEVLDIGTGLGLGAQYLARNRAKKVLGIDNSESAIMLAKQKISLSNLEFKVMDAVSLSLPLDSFDLVVAFEIIEHLSPARHQEFLIKITKLLKHGGVFLISTPNRLTSSGGRGSYNPYHIKEFEPLEFLNTLQEHFAQVSLMGIRCVNESYLKKQKELEIRLINRIASFLGRYRIVREILAYIPKGLKQEVTSESRLPSLKESDFEISSCQIENSEGLLAICRGGKDFGCGSYIDS